MRVNLIFIWMLLLTATTVLAQEPDSIVITYDNQHTTIAMPALGKKTTIKMADSVQIIEIDVSRRKLTDLPYSTLSPSKNASTEKPLKKTKWFSAMEAGYVTGFVDKDRFAFYTSDPPYVYHVNNDPLPGFSLALSVFDREQMLKDNLSYNLGFKLGIDQLYRIKKPETEIPIDTINHEYHIYIDNDSYSVTGLQMLIPVGMRYTIGSVKNVSKISFGANLGIGLGFQRFKEADINRNSKYYIGISPIVQTYIGYEHNKIGILGTVEFTSLGNLTPLSAIKYKLGLSLTYRFF